MIHLGGTICDDKVCGINGVHKRSSEVDGATACVGHLLLGPVRRRRERGGGGEGGGRGRRGRRGRTEGREGGRREAEGERKEAKGREERRRGREGRRESKKEGGGKVVHQKDITGIFLSISVHVHH